MKERILTVSNLLSISRIVLMIPVAILLLIDDPANRWYVVALMIIATLTDTFDGMLARKLNQVTDFGKMLDPIADKIAICVVVVILLIQSRLPLWFVAIIILRDLLILAGGIYIKKKKHITLQSNKTGKWAVTVIAFMIIITVIDFDELFWLKEILLYSSVVMLFLSFVLYLKRFFAEIRSMNPDIQKRN